MKYCCKRNLGVSWEFYFPEMVLCLVHQTWHHLFFYFFHLCDHTKMELALTFLCFFSGLARRGLSLPLLWLHVAVEELCSLEVQCYDHTMGQILQNPTPLSISDGHLCTLFPLASAANVQCT